MPFMVAATALDPVEAPRTEQRIVIPCVPWKVYVLLRDAIDTPRLRMTYCEGVLELMSPSRAHELKKKTIARFLELYAFLRKLPLVGYGSTTFRREAKQRGAEPDECYRVGSLMGEGEFPDVVLEVIETRPVLDKLAVYDGFEVPEVWLFDMGAFEIYRRRARGGYARARRSAFFPELDLALVARFASREDQHVALGEFAAAVDAAKPRRKKRR